MLSMSPDVLNTDSIQSYIVKHIRIENHCLGHVMLLFVQRRVAGQSGTQRATYPMLAAVIGIWLSSISAYIMSSSCWMAKGARCPSGNEDAGLVPPRA